MEEVIKIPKILLHIHLDGSVDINLLYEWLKEDGYDLSFDEAKKKFQVDKDCKSLNQYLDKFNLPCRLLNSKERLKKACRELFLKLDREGVVYAEVRFAPLKHINDNLNGDSAVDAVVEGMREAFSKTKIRGGIILCCMRDFSFEDNIKTVDLALKYLNKGVVGIDLAGAEAVYKTEDFKDVFKYANKLNIPFTIHAGEADGISSIDSAILFGATRIGHGIRAIDSEEEMKKLIDNNILLEICVSSNYQTEVVKDHHPIEEFIKRGIKVSINTDNDTVSNININSEYKYILDNTNITVEDIRRSNYNAIDFIFADDNTKNELKKIIDFN